MIVPMKRLSLVVLARNKIDSLKKLRKAGIVHLDEVELSNSTFEELTLKEQQLEKSIQQLSQLYNQAQKIENKELFEVVKQREFDEIDAKVSKLFSKQELLSEKIQKESIEKEKLSKWGNFSIEELNSLKDQGINFEFYFVPTKELRKIEEQTDFIVLRSNSKNSLIATVNSKLGDEIIKEHLVTGSLSLDELSNSIEKNKKLYAENEKELINYSYHLSSFKHYKEVVSQEINFENAKELAKEEGVIAYLSGFVPVDALDNFKELAAKESWAYALADPNEEHHVPTKIKNSKWVSIIKPVFDILGTVPGYHEYDISMWFLMFFTLFFAMIVGDGAYGLIFLAVALIAHKKVGEANNAIILLYVLSIANIIWGALTGTWFGSLYILEKIPFLQRLIIPQIANYPELFNIEATYAQQTVMKFCFIVGTLQLALACAINIYRKIEPKDLSAVADFGWLVMIAALYYLVLMLVIGTTINVKSVAIAIGVGFVLVVAFNAQGPGISFLKGLAGGASGLFSTFLDSISAFSNIISYIRLFAVGMASLAIAQSFNSMASGLLKGFALPAGLFVLIIGHGLNLVMALLSVVVHGVRLNLLEFSGQLGMEWTGTNYNPFRETVKK